MGFSKARKVPFRKPNRNQIEIEIQLKCIYGANHVKWKSNHTPNGRRERDVQRRPWRCSWGSFVFRIYYDLTACSYCKSAPWVPLWGYAEGIERETQTAFKPQTPSIPHLTRFDIIAVTSAVVVNMFSITQMNRTMPVKLREQRLNEAGEEMDPRWERETGYLRSYRVYATSNGTRSIRVAFSSGISLSSTTDGKNRFSTASYHPTVDSARRPTKYKIK